MVQWLIVILLLLVLAVDVLDGIVLVKWDRELERMESNASTQGRLLRWYAEGAQRPTQRVYLLLWASMVLTLLSLLGQQPAWLIVVSAALGFATWVEWRFGKERLRTHLHRALARGI